MAAVIGPPGVAGSTTGRTCRCWNCHGGCSCSCFTCRPAPPPATLELWEHRKDVPNLPGPAGWNALDPVRMKATFVCFPCKKVMKKVFQGGVDAVVWGDLLLSQGGATVRPGSTGLNSSTYHEKCPKCQRATYCVGPAFEAPKAGDARAWRRQEVLAEAGYTSSPCNCFKEGNRAALARLGVDSPDQVRLP